MERLEIDPRDVEAWLDGVYEDHLNGDPEARAHYDGGVDLLTACGIEVERGADGSHTTNGGDAA